MTLKAAWGCLTIQSPSKSQITGFSRISRLKLTSDISQAMSALHFIVGIFCLFVFGFVFKAEDLYLNPHLPGIG